MKLYLSSYKLGNETENLKEWIAEKGSHIIVIPNALDMFSDSERKTKGIEEKCDELKELGFTPEVFDLRSYFGNPKDLRDRLLNCNAFYVLGGNVFVLRTAMKLSGFDEFLKEISVLPNYLYSGFSAGICVLAKDLHGIHLADDEKQDPYNYGTIIWDGVGLIDYMPVPHYDTPNHPESYLMFDVVKYLNENNLPYKTLRDGDVIINEIEPSIKKHM